ncbi:MAG: hypothetical protein AAGH92_06135 [Planctomycetota bacterium]
MSVADSGNPGVQRWVTVGAYANGWEADLALGLLQAEGLPAHLENREFVGMDWTLAAAVGWIKVQAPVDVAEAARAVLAKMESAGRAGDIQLSEVDLAETEHCLRCGEAMSMDDAACGACGWSYGSKVIGGVGDMGAQLDSGHGFPRIMVRLLSSTLLLALILMFVIALANFTAAILVGNGWA